MKTFRCALGVLTLLGCAGSARGAIKLADEQAVVLGGASLPPGRGVASNAEGVSKSAPARAFDGLNYTNWLADIAEGKPCWLEFRFDDDVCWVLTEYSLSNGAMSADHDPKEWELQGSLDGVSWATLDSRKKESFSGRRWTRNFKLRQKEAYNRYRLVFPSAGNNPQIELSEVGFIVKAHVLPPAEVSAHAERGCAVLDWQPSEWATGYTVRRSAERLGAYVRVASGVQGTHYEDKGPFQDSEMSYYTVSSEASSAQGAMSVPISVPTPVAPPADLKAKRGKGLVVLEWTPSSKAVAYVVRRSLSKEGPYTVIGSQITAPAYTDEGLSEGTAYYYVVCGVANGKEGVDTAPVGALFPPGAPTGLAAEPAKEAVILKWNAVALATSYKVLRATSADAPREELGVVTGETAFTDKTANFKQTYYYTVAAVNACGVGVESAGVAASPLRPPSWWRR